MAILTSPTTLMFLLLGSMLIITLMRVAVPLGQPIAGKALLRFDLTYRERMLLHRTNLYAIGVVLLLAAWSNVLPLLAELAVILATFVIIMMPTRYIITSEGVALNNVVFRRWSEFSGVEVRRGRIRLLGLPGNAPFTIGLLVARRPTVLPSIERLIGHPTPNATPPSPPRRVRKRVAAG